MPRPTRGGNGKQAQPGSGQGNTATKCADSWIFLMNDDVIKNETDGEDSQPVLCKLRHPKTRAGVLYLISGDYTSIYEIHRFEEKYRCWFVGDYVRSDGQIYITAPMDPLFIVLPYFISAQENGRFMTIEQLICDEDFPDSQKLLTCCSQEQLALISDFKDVDDDLCVYRYSKEKTLSWLKQKIEALANALDVKGVIVSSKGSHSAMFVPSKSSAASKDAYMEYAYGIVCDYIPVALAEELRKFAGIPEITKSSSSTPDVTAENEPPNKKTRLDSEVAPVEDYSGCVDLKSEKAKAGKLSAAQKKLSKVDKTGMKSISSFFSPKT